MNKLILLVAIFFAACTGSVRQDGNKQETDKTNANAGEAADTLTNIPLDNGRKWKADSTTKLHVQSIQRIVNDNKYQSAPASKALAAQLKLEVDSLVKECTMKGPAHDALHVWLEGLLENIKKLQEEEADEYAEVRADLQKHVAGFYDAFE